MYNLKNWEIEKKIINLKERKMYRFKILISNWDSFFFFYFHCLVFWHVLLPTSPPICLCFFFLFLTLILVYLFSLVYLRHFLGSFWILHSSRLRFSNGMNQVYARKTKSSMWFSKINDEWKRKNTRIHQHPVEPESITRCHVFIAFPMVCQQPNEPKLRSEWRWRG